MADLAHVLRELAGQDVLVLSEASTEVERDVVRGALPAARPHIELVEASDRRLGTELVDDDRTVVPVRVTWLPDERDGERRAGLRELLVLQDPRHPPARMQARLVADDADRHRLVVGEAATVADLRRRWKESTGGAGGDHEFSHFVARQGSLALERAERAVIGERYKVPRLVVEEISHSARFRDDLRAMARELGRRETDVVAEARAALEKLVASQSRLAMDAFDAITSPLFQRAWELDVDTAALAQLRELNRERGLIFLPAHRSYVDPLVLGRALDDAGFPRNLTPGGQNLDFWPLGSIARRAGIIFIPRTLKGDPVTKFVLREYFGYLTAKRFNLEWYMEAGRSRTGKLRPPRFGLLQFVVDALRSGRVDDVALVPVSITYDRLPEVSLMAAEEQGLPKQAEGLRWLFNYARGNMQQELGTVHVRFAEPLSLRDGLAMHEDRGAEPRLAMQKVGFEVFHRINGVTPITPMSLVTLALLGVDGRALTDDEVLAVVAPFVDYLDARGLPLTDRDAVTDPLGVRGTLARLESAGIVSRYVEGTVSVYAIEPGQHHAAAFYRNSGIHWFVNRAIAEVAVTLVGPDGGDDPMEAAWQQALALRDLLKFEFFFSDKRRFLELMIEERRLLGVVDEEPPSGPDAAARVLRNAGFLAAPIVLRPFLEAFYVVSDRLAAHSPRDAIDRAAFVDECAAVGRQYLLQHRLRNPEGVSPELFKSALNLVDNRDLFDPGRDSVAMARLEFAEEVARVLRGVDAVEEIDAERRRAAGDTGPGRA